LSSLLFVSVGIRANVAESEPNDDFTNAQRVGVNTTVNAHMSPQDKDDYFVVEVPSDGTFTISTCSDAALRLDRMYVCVQDGSEFKERNSKDMDGKGEAGRVEKLIISDVKAGTYYVHVTRYNGEGDYTIAFAHTPSEYANDAEPNDDFEHAQAIALDTDVQGHLGYYSLSSDKDVWDWYKIELPADGTVDFQTTTETTLRLGRLRVYRQNGEDISERCSKDMDANNKDTTIVFTVSDLAKGTYYFSLNHYGGYGGYVLNCNFTSNTYASDDEPNNEWTQAQPIACGQDIQGHLGYINVSNEKDIYDWYRIDLPADGSVVFRTTTETTLRLGRIWIHALDGNVIHERCSKDMDAYNKDTTIVYTVSDLAKGTYYFSLKQYDGCGGYIINCDFAPDRFFSDNVTYTEKNPYQLTKNKAFYTTLGYTYYNDTRKEQWYSFTTDKPATLEIQPDTTLSLCLGIVEVFKKKPDGTWASLYRERLERTYRSFDISEAGDYLVCVPRYSGQGGVSVRYGEDESGLITPGSAIRVIVEGRNTVRKGVPCQNTLVVRNTSDKKTGSLLVALSNTEDINILKINLSDIHGRYGEDMYFEDICDSDSSVVLYIPSLAPFEDYKVLVTSEGVGDIDYVAPYHRGTKSITGTILVAGAIGFAVDACVDAAGDWLKGKVKEQVGELSDSEAEAYRRCMGLTRQQYEDTKYSGDGYGACVAKKAMEKTMKGVMAAVPGGKTAMNIGEKVAESADIITCMRRKLWYWVGKQTGAIPDDGSQIYDAKVGVNGVVASWDPNEMVGPQGTGEQHYIGQTKTIDYTILFENKAEAGAPAYRVRVFNDLDTTVFDASTVRFGATSHDGVGYNWKMSRNGNRLSWDIEGIELPPNKVAPEGEGFVTFSVDLKPGLTDGTQIANKATIIFDKNTPIETNVYSNVLDLEAPVTTMLSAKMKDSTNIVVTCKSNDSKSGAATYQLYASLEGSPYILQGIYPAGDIIFTAPCDGLYSFYILAVDNAGNTETTIPQAISISTDLIPVSSDPLRPDSDAVYDIYGRRVENPFNHPGIYIQQGRKLLIH